METKTLTVKYQKVERYPVIQLKRADKNKLDMSQVQLQAVKTKQKNPSNKFRKKSWQHDRISDLEC